MKRSTLIEFPAPRHKPVSQRNVVIDTRKRPTTGRAAPIRFCHFSTAHTEPKSRSLHRLCLPLASAGISVSYISPAQQAGLCDGVNFVPLERRRTRLGRALQARSLFRALLDQNANLYHFQDTELLPLAFALNLLFHKRVIYDAYEDFPAIAGEHDRIPRVLRPLVRRLVGGVEYLAACCFEAITTADPITLQRFARAGKSRKLVHYNFPNLDFFPPPGLGSKEFDLVYRGGLSERAGTFLLLDALRLLKLRAKSARLLLIGYYDSPRSESELKERIRNVGLESSVEMRGRIKHEAMAEALSRAKIGVCPLLDTPKFRKNIPVKIFEYWACGLPVIASDLPPIRPFIRDERAGLTFATGNASALADSIAWLMEHPTIARRMGEAGRKAVEERFNNCAEVHKLLRFCEQIASAT